MTSSTIRDHCIDHPIPMVPKKISRRGTFRHGALMGKIVVRGKYTPSIVGVVRPAVINKPDHRTPTHELR
jgi:hypothetical protein